MNQDLDLTVQHRSFRDGQRVYNIALEAAWWQKLDKLCSRKQARDWILIWIQEAYDKSTNRQALIRLKIHEMVLEDAQEQAQAQDRAQDLVQRIERMRAKRMPWARIASALAECELIPNWSSEDVRKFYYKHMK